MAVVTSFDTARRHVSLLDNLPWTVLVVDEAHRLKNPKSRTTRALGSFYWPENHIIPGHVTELTPTSASESRPSATPESLCAQPSASIPRTGPIRIALTGTAIQNSYMELWTLLDWANPSSVGSETSGKRWSPNRSRRVRREGAKKRNAFGRTGPRKSCGISYYRSIFCEGTPQDTVVLSKTRTEWVQNQGHYQGPNPQEI